MFQSHLMFVMFVMFHSQESSADVGQIELKHHLDQIDWNKLHTMANRSPGLVVMGEDWWSIGRDFEFRHSILDGNFHIT